MNCKPGDLAYIVHDPHNPQDIGKVVKVLRVATDWCEEDMPEWRCEARDQLSGFNGGREWKPGQHKAVDIPDAWLRPISGVPVEDEQRDEVPA